MPMLEVDYTWTFTSTGVGARIDGTQVREWTFHVECANGSTGEVEIQVARDLSTTTLGVQIGSSQAIASSVGAGLSFGFTGPYAAIFPRCSKLTASGSMIVRGIGN